MTSVNRTLITTPDQEVFRLNDLRDTGLLWLINATVFHPRGFAIGVNGDHWTIVGDGTDVFTFTDERATARFADAERFLNSRRPAEPEEEDAMIPEPGDGLPTEAELPDYRGAGWTATSDSTVIRQAKAMINGIISNPNFGYEPWTNAQLHAVLDLTLRATGIDLIGYVDEITPDDHPGAWWRDD